MSKYQLPEFIRFILDFCKNTTNSFDVACLERIFDYMGYCLQTARHYMNHTSGYEV